MNEKSLFLIFYVAPTFCFFAVTPPPPTTSASPLPQGK